MNAPNKDTIAFVPTTNDDEKYVAMNDHQSLKSSEITAGKIPNKNNLY
jgi:hypothetical protein